MPITTLLTAADGTYGGWTLGAGATKWQALRTADDDTSYCNSGVNNDTYTAVMDDLPAYAGTIATHTVRTRCHRHSGVNTPTEAVGLFISGIGATWGANQSPVVWTNWSEVDLAKPGGGTWTPAAVNSAEVCLQRMVSTGDACCTLLAWDVTWQPHAGDFASFVASIGALAALGGNLLLGEMPAFARYCASLTRKPRTVFLASELEPLWRQLREWKFQRSVYVPGY